MRPYFQKMLKKNLMDTSCRRRKRNVWLFCKGKQNGHRKKLYSQSFKTSIPLCAYKLLTCVFSHGSPTLKALPQYIFTYNILVFNHCLPWSPEVKVGLISDLQLHRLQSLWLSFAIPLWQPILDSKEMTLITLLIYIFQKEDTMSACNLKHIREGCNSIKIYFLSYFS